jgi:hypothetical protein
MRNCAGVAIALGFLLAAGAGLLPGDSDKEADQAKINRLIQQLGDNQFARRQAASKTLAKLGKPALAALRRAAVSSTDAEVRSRARRLVAAIEKKLGYLFNGRDLTGWYVESGNARQWAVKGGAIVARSADYRTRNYLLSKKEYADFTLRLEYKVDPGGGGGVVIRALPGEKIVSTVDVDHPVLKLNDPGKFPDYWTGTTHFVKDARQYIRPAKDLKLPAGTWHTLELTVRSDSCSAVLDGKKTVALRLDRRYRGAFVPGLKRTRGRIGLQAHTGTIRFRHVRIKELVQRPRAKTK